MPLSEEKRLMRMYNNPHYILKISTPPRMIHTTPKQGYERKRDLEFSKYKVPNIPPYMHKIEEYS